MISYLSMSLGMKCANCGKGVAYGHEVSHAKNRTKRLFKPNLHFAKIKVDGESRRVKLCAKCLRMIKREVTVAVKQTVSSVPAVST